MDRLFLILRRRQLNFLVLLILTYAISLSTIAKCASVDTIQDIPHNKHKFSNTNHGGQNIHRLVTKDTNLYSNPTGFFDGTSKKITGKISTLYNIPLENNSNWDSTLSSGLNVLKFLSSMNENCGNENNVVKCIGDIIFRSISIILQSTDSYENTGNVRNWEKRNGRGPFLGPEGNITLLEETVMKHLKNYILSVNLTDVGNEVKESARAGLSWFKPGKSRGKCYTLIR